MRARLHVLAVVLAAGIVALGGPAEVAADEAEAPVEAPRPDLEPAEIARWIKALVSESYAERKEATQKLTAAGGAAVAAVAAAADADGLELTGRCLGILRRWQQSGDAETKHAVGSALRQLAGSPRRHVARSASAALERPVAWASHQQAARAVQVRAVGFGAPRRLPAPQPRRLVRELTVDDDGRKVYLRYESGDNPGPAYLIRVTETVDGQERVTEYKADSATELRQKHPEGYALFSKHSRELYSQRPNIVPNPPVVIGQRFPAPAALPFAARGRIQVRVNNAGGQVDIQAEENGRQVHITHNAGREIVIRVTSVGRPETAEYKARDLEELKRLHPEEIAQLYEKYASLPQRVRVQAGGGGVQIERIPLGGMPLPGTGDPSGAGGAAAPEADRRQRLEQLRERMNERNVEARAEQLRLQNEAARKVLELAREQLQRSRRNLDEQARRTAELERHLADVAASLKKLADRGEIRPDELRRLAEEIDRLSAPPRRDDAAPEAPAGRSAPADRAAAADAQ